MKYYVSITSIIFFACTSINQAEDVKVIPAAHRVAEYLPKLRDKNIGLVVNHTSTIGNTHLIDSLLSHGINISVVFTPEHGLGGTASNGEKIEYQNNNANYHLVSLYGQHKKPTQKQLYGIELIVFDIQDVGVRFYTYISTMHYVMEACATYDIPLLILDRPNPNARYIDGPVLNAAYRSFAGMHPIPIVYGLTIGELATMINGEGWLENGRQCKLEVVKLKNWDHQKSYSLPIRPSPNLSNDLSISLYPELCLFEGTIISVGRGTKHPFQQIGHPDYPETAYSFVPYSNKGAKSPPYEGQKCYGVSWVGHSPAYKFSLAPLIDTYRKMNDKEFFNEYFNKLAGTNQLKKQIVLGLSETEIRKTWQKNLKKYKIIRKKYLLYPS